MNYWVKGYKYTKIPAFFRRWDIFGLTFIIQSHKTKRRRVGIKKSSDEMWNAYESLLRGKKI